jgi:hypothetical protein
MVIAMQRQCVNEVFEEKAPQSALETLAEKIARWTEGGELHTTSIPGLSLFRRH